MKNTDNSALYICLESTSFVKDDKKTLSKLTRLKYFKFGITGRRKLLFLLKRWIVQFFWLCRQWSQTDIVFGWFVDYHMLLPVLFSLFSKRPVIIFVGGFECFNVPELKYGIFNSWWRAPIARFIFRRASLLLPVSERLVLSRNKYTSWPECHDYGIRAQMPGLKTRICPLPTGYDPEKWPMSGGERKRIVCTTGLIDSERTFKRKGIDIYIETAKKKPDVQFLLIGVSDSMKQKIEARHELPANVMLKGRIPREKLKDVYRDVSVYVQLSRIEGLPNVLCEAMLCGCIPVGSNVFGIPEAIGDTGYIVEEPDPEIVATYISKALSDPDSKRKKAREHIIELYSAGKRETFIADLVANTGKFA